MKQVQLHELSRFSARFNTALQLEGSDLTVRYRGRVLNLESTDQGVTISGDKYEQKIFADEVASVFALSGKLILTLESGAIITLLNVKEKEAGDPTVNKGVKVLNANSAPKDPASRADLRKKAIAQGYSGVRYETEEGYEIDEDGKGIKVLPAEQQPKDPEDRKKKRAMYIAQGFDGVRYEGEEEPDEDDEKGQDLVDDFKESSSTFNLSRGKQLLAELEKFNYACGNSYLEDELIRSSIFKKIFKTCEEIALYEKM